MEHRYRGSEREQDIHGNGIHYRIRISYQMVPCKITRTERDERVEIRLPCLFSTLCCHECESGSEQTVGRSADKSDLVTDKEQFVSGRYDHCRICHQSSGGRPFV